MILEWVLLFFSSFALTVGLGAVALNLIWLRQMHRERSKKPNPVEEQEFPRTNEVFEEMTATGITPTGVSWFNEVPVRNYPRHQKAKPNKRIGWRRK